MSVFTIVSRDSLIDHLAQYSIGELIDFEGLSGGTVNSNYRIVTTAGEYVLTLLETTPIALAKQIVQFIQFLNQADYPTPALQATQAGEIIQLFYGKPTIIVEFIKGQSPTHPTSKQCFQVGSALGRLHTLTEGYLTPIENTMGNHWRESTAFALMPHFTEEEQSLIKEILAEEQKLPFENLPKGIIHFDLFRDNVLLDDNGINAIIDFYYACYDCFITDLSICINDWCTDWQQGDGSLINEHYQALLQGYESQRPLSMLEKETLPSMMQITAMHFWLTRTQTQILNKSGPDVLMKNPEEYKKMLIQRQDL